MLPETIEKLLNSKDESDNQIGWEMVENQKIPHADIMDYMERTKIPVQFKYRYYFDNQRFKWVKEEEDEDDFHM